MSTKGGASAEERFAALERKISQFSLTLPVLDHLQSYLLKHGCLKGKRIGWHCHLTEITAAAAKVLLMAGADLYLSECNSATTDGVSAHYMEDLGAKVFLGADSPDKVLSYKPEVISDTGFVLIGRYLDSLQEGTAPFVKGACEITSSGIEKLRISQALGLPIININDGELKTYIENFHGVGDGVINALFQVTGRVWSGRSVCVVGYGRVGAGVAAHLRKSGADVCVAEMDSARKLIAHYDGFKLTSLANAIASCELVVTATGRNSLILAKDLEYALDGLILMNVGHWPEEINVVDLKAKATSCKPLGDYLEELQFEFGGNAKRILLLGGGGPANVVMCSGSPEPTLIHLVTEILCMNFILGLPEMNEELSAGENTLPWAVRNTASELSLNALGIS